LVIMLIQLNIRPMSQFKLLRRADSLCAAVPRVAPWPPPAKH
jgi:hypothetical protein